MNQLRAAWVDVAEKMVGEDGALQGKRGNCSGNSILKQLWISIKKVNC